MKKFIVTLTAPSVGLIGEGDNYFEPYIVEAPNLDELSRYVDNKLMRKFAITHRVSLSDVRILFAAVVK